jgi:hypothetical protein
MAVNRKSDDANDIVGWIANRWQQEEFSSYAVIRCALPTSPRIGIVVKCCDIPKVFYDTRVISSVDESDVMSLINDMINGLKT